MLSAGAQILSSPRDVRGQLGIDFITAGEDGLEASATKKNRQEWLSLALLWMLALRSIHETCHLVVARVFSTRTEIIPLEAVILQSDFRIIRETGARQFKVSNP